MSAGGGIGGDWGGLCGELEWAVVWDVERAEEWALVWAVGLAAEWAPGWAAG